MVGECSLVRMTDKERHHVWTGSMPEPLHALLEMSARWSSINREASRAKTGAKCHMQIRICNALLIIPPVVPIPHLELLLLCLVSTDSGTANHLLPQM